MKNYLFSTTVCFLFLVQLSAQISQFGGPNRNGVYDELGLLDEWPANGATLAATISGIGDGYGSPTVNENGIFIAGMIDSTTYIFHFDHNYNLKWKSEVGREYSFKYVGSRGTPTVEGNLLYYVAAFGDAVCINATTGEKLWHINIQKEYKGPEIKWVSSSV